MRAPVPCGIRHVRLDQPLTPLVPEPGEQSLLVFFWWNRLPLGRRLFTSLELPVPAEAIGGLGADASSPALAAWFDAVPTDLVAALQDLDRSIDGRAQRASDTLSVVVCTRDRPQALTRCIASLLECEPRADEILVVDNAPENDATRKLCEGFPGVRYVLEPTPGLSRARNKGISAAKGEIIAFTDDDVEVEPSWIAGLRAGFSDDSVASVTGPVLPRRLESEAAFAFEFDYGGLAASFLPRRFDPGFLRQQIGEAPPVWQIGAGANMAIRRSAFTRIGLFDMRLGAGASGCSEDSELWHRILAAGLCCRYEPAAVVHHQHRDNLPALRRQMRAYMRGHVAALMVQFEQTRHPGNLIRAFVGLPVWMSAVALRHAFSRQSTRRSLVGWELLGLLEGPFQWLRRGHQIPTGEQQP